MEHLIPSTVVAPVRVPFDFSPVGGDLSDDDVTTIIQALLDPDSSRLNSHPTLDSVITAQEHGLSWILKSGLWFRILRIFVDPDRVMEDFLHRTSSGELYLTTEALERHLNTWQTIVTQLDPQQHTLMQQGIVKELSDIASMISNLTPFLEQRYSDFSEKGQLNKILHDQLGMAHLACFLLLQVVAYACGSILGFSSRNILGPYHQHNSMPWLQSRMEIEGWCPYTVWRMCDSSPVEMLAYAYFLGSKRTSQDHRKCTRRVCLANASLENTEPKHVDTVCGCQIVQARVDTIVEIIRADDIPVLQIKRGPDGALELVPHAQSKGHKYVALSHVWADGLGSSSLKNPNTIRNCQLDRILDRLIKLDQRDDCGELFVWIDTLCIPVDPQYQALRDSQVARMHNIYKNAYCVLVIDPDFLTLRDDASIRDIGLRILMSIWSSRLWTYQEGSVAQRVLLMSQDVVVDVDQVIKRELDVDTEQTAGNRTLTDSLSKGMAGAAFFILGRPLRTFSEPKSWKPESRTALEKMYQEGDADTQSMLWIIKDRISTRPDDEAIILAASMGIDTQAVLRATTDQRMIAFIKSIPHVPANLLFTTGPRLTQPGFRWAPKSVLRVNGAVTCRPIPSLIPMNLEAKKRGVSTVRPTSILDSTGRGLISFNPAIIIDKVYITNDIFTFELFGQPIGFSFLDGEYRQEFSGSERVQIFSDLLKNQKNLAILTRDFDPNNQITLGVLIEILSETVPLEEQKGYSDATVTRFVGVGSFNYYNYSALGETERLNIADSRGEWLSPRLWLVD
jgi:Heterokaryon incompatibility protein (HET)